jgi:hypothetical protein
MAAAAARSDTPTGCADRSRLRILGGYAAERETTLLPALGAFGAGPLGRGCAYRRSLFRCPAMTPEEALARIEHAAGASGLQPVRVTLGSGRPALAGRTSEFRWRWIATRLHTFLVAAPFPPETGPAELDGFIAEATRYAKDSKGGLPRGLQTGVAALVVAVTSGPSPGAVEWASAVHGRHFAAVPWPILVDTASETVTQPQKMKLGGIYKAYLQEMARKVVVAPVTG